jgi:uncharacterized protein YndB with AHSA1/START domain
VARAETKAVVEVEVRIAASPETVFDFLVDPDKLIQWMGRSARLDPRPGGRFHCDMNGVNIAGGEYLEVEPPSRAVFTWGWEGERMSIGPGGSTVEVLLEPDGDGTHVRLIHRDLPTEESARKHGHGWDHYLARLAAAAGGEDPGPDPWATPDGAPGSETD